MSTRRVTKATSSSKSDKDNGVPTLTKGAQKLMVVSKKFAKQQKAETTPTSEKAPQQTLDRAEISAAATPSAKTKAANERTSVPLTISPPKMLVEVEPTDGITVQGRETDAGVFTAIQADGDFARRASLKEEIGRPSLPGSGGPKLGDLSWGTPRSESRGPRLWVLTNGGKNRKTPGRSLRDKEILGQMDVPEKLEEIRKVVAKPAPRPMNYAEAATKPKSSQGRRRERPLALL
ncbi:hypothetical protein EVAR_87161_1 [Eumeta japonica]|uniref:Uncharacterized protein n=1 Tax=Eumeta variegata TaxID=151549 RepID=A0A4C1VVN0_EUMVA|nr:hypothetical protein EVAR_87161_1 [Eumeta japonica]